MGSAIAGGTLTEMPGNLEAETAALDRIVNSSPHLAARWAADWGSDPDRNPYVEAMTVSHLVLDAAIAGDREEIATVSDAIEQEFQTADPGVLNFLQIGIIESIQHHASAGSDIDRHGVTPGTIRALLGPHAQVSWADLDRFWGNSVDDV
jgi:hypothetical protein